MVGTAPFREFVRGWMWSSMLGNSSSMDINVENKTIALQIPPCIASSSVGERLAERILSDSWAFHKKTEVDESWLRPTPVNNMLKHERRLGRRAEPVHVCATCGGNGRRKCTRCLHTYYCTPVCQERDWRRHRTTCIPMESSLQEYLAIAVPDFRCFFQYQDALARRANSEEDVGICIMSLGIFSEMFGEKMILRTCVNLAINGKPSELLVKVIGGNIVEGSGALDARPETRGHA